MQDFSAHLLEWYYREKRDLPWRGTQNPYKIWLSEIILQQTRVEQGWRYYLSFVENYPSVEDLAAASEQQVLKLWQGLGYYSRARNLHFTAQYITEELGGIFPNSYSELLKLKGVGKYTAAAIASFAYGEAVAAIDGNVYRVLSRFFGEYETINTPKAEKVFRQLAEAILPRERAGDFNQAMMELGAVVCKPQNPDCLSCPVGSGCFASANGKQMELPIKKKAIKVKNRYFNYFILSDKTHILLKKREGKDVWKHLYEFVLLEEQNLNIEQAATFLLEHLGLKNPYFQNLTQTPVVHKLSHQHLHIQFWAVSALFSKAPKGYEWIKIADLKEDYPLPIVLADFIKDFESFSQRFPFGDYPK